MTPMVGSARFVLLMGSARTASAALAIVAAGGAALIPAAFLALALHAFSAVTAPAMTRGAITPRPLPISAGQGGGGGVRGG